MPKFSRKFSRSLDGVERTILSAVVRLSREECDKLQAMAEREKQSIEDYLSTVLMEWAERKLRTR